MVLVELRDDDHNGLGEVDHRILWACVNRENLVTPGNLLVREPAALSAKHQCNSDTTPVIIRPSQRVFLIQISAKHKRLV